MARGIVRVVAAAPYGSAKRLREFVEGEARRRDGLLAGQFVDHPDWDPKARLTRAEAAAGRVERAAWLEDQRRTGVFLDTKSAALSFGVPAELADRGWDHPWPPAPPEAQYSGRWPGSRDGGWPDRVTANLADALVERVVAACWHTSEPAIVALRAWRDEHPDVLIRADAGDAAALAEYERLAEEVTTPGTIWRAGLERVLPGESTTGS